MCSSNILCYRQKKEANCVISRALLVDWIIHIPTSKWKKNCLYAPVQEEVVAVLKQAKEGKPVESVRLVDRQLRQLPEAFGRIQGLRVLDDDV